MRSLTILRLFAVCGALAFSPVNAVAQTEVVGVMVDGTSLTVTLTDGRILTGPELIGFSFTVADHQGSAVEIRIEGAQPGTSFGGVHWLYDLKMPDATSSWVSYCGLGPDGGQLGFPIAGFTDSAGTFQLVGDAVTFTCTSGVIAKCIRMGYSPWNPMPDNAPVLDRFRACTRMMRADYCGTGQTHTKDGTMINVYDRQSLRRGRSVTGLAFEAAWGPGGALCVARTRWDSLLTLDQLQSDCGAKLEGRIGQGCDPESAHRLPEAFLFNESSASP